jgi:hypothetical protein
MCFITRIATDRTDECAQYRTLQHSVTVPQTMLPKQKYSLKGP